MAGRKRPIPAGAFVISVLSNRAERCHNCLLVEFIGVIGDIHAEDVALEIVLERLRSLGVDAIFAVGDVVDGPGDVDRCCALLQSHEVQTVRGNHDRWFLAGELRTIPHATQTITEANRRFLASLPATIEIETSKGRVLVCHGVADDDMSFLRPDTRGYGLQSIPALRELKARADVQFMIGGHTHERMVRSFTGLTVVNVGTLHRADQPCFATLDFGSETVTFYLLADSRLIDTSETLRLPMPTKKDCPLQ